MAHAWHTLWVTVAAGPLSSVSLGSNAASTPRLYKAWVIMIVYTVFVILFGAVVRITGSGAGCGQHWPTCQGEIAPLPRDLEMLIEFSHRLTSGLSMLLLFALCIYTCLRTTPGHMSRKGALWACFFMVTEALIGARLVLLGLVGQNDTAPRAVIMALHLINTSALLAAMLFVLRGLELRGLGERGLGERPKPSFLWRSLRALPAFVMGTVLLLAISGAGAVTALGDTLYPVVSTNSSAHVVLDATNQGAHFLERLRGVHPLMAALGAAFLFWVTLRLPDAWRVRSVLIWLLALQLGAGVVNVALSAPGWMQVVHLALATFLWLAWLWAFWDQAVAKSVESTSPGRRVLVEARE